jgi:DNA-binding NarL/FixJ family response regulator
MSRNKTLPILKIVTVEDSPLVAERVQWMLTEIAHVEFLGNARSTSEALILIDEKKPNVVILDIKLDRSSAHDTGIHLLVILRSQYPEMKIIMLTNLSDTPYRNTCMALGADHFFDKSNDFDKVSLVLQEMLL